MQQIFLKQNHTDNLVLIFLGYGQAEEPFLKLKEHSRNDLALVYDYQDFNFDESLYQSYQRIDLICWSMGVMIAPIVLDNSKLLSKVNTAIALNGTYEGIDDNYGIAKKLFKATIDGLDESNYLKFVRRMCQSVDSYKQYLEHRPKRSLESLKSELSYIYENAQLSKTYDPCNFKYTKAICGQKDKIIAYQSQYNAWQKTPVIMESKAIAHYDESTFIELLEQLNQ